MVYQKRRGTATIALSGTSTTASEVVSGELGAIVVQVPALTGTGTVTVRGTQELGGTLYGIGTLLESTTTVIQPAANKTPFDGTIGFLIEETSGTQSAAADIVYDLYYTAKHG